MINIKNKIYIIAACISVLLSIVAYHNADPLNYDGILYLATAQTYLQSGFRAAAALYSWPYYSILIAALSRLTQLSLLHSAQLINAILLAAIVINFIKLVEKITQQSRWLIAAAVVILAFPTLNHYRDLIVRDFGYWAFALIGLNQLINYARTWRWFYAFTWAIAAIAAALFRIEGAILLIFTPFALLFLEGPGAARIKNLLKLFFLPLLFSALYLSVHHFIAPGGGLMIGRMQELIDVFTSGLQLTINSAHTKIAAINDYVIDKNTAGGDSASWFFFGFSGLFIKNIVNTFTALYALLAVYAVYKKLLPLTNTVKIIIYFLFLNLTIGLVFYAQHLFLSDRYLVAACLALLVWVVFALEHLYDLWLRKQQRWVFPLIALIFSITALSGVISFGYSKAYIRDAGLWLKQNTPHTASIYSNNKQILFYAERTPINHKKIYDDGNPLLTLQHEQWQGYNYLAVRINKNAEGQTASVIKAIGRQPIKTFANKRGDKVLIFLLSQPEQ